MTSEFELRLSPPGSAVGGRAVFHWLADRSSTIYSSVLGRKHLGPSLGALGPVPDLNIDLVRIAATVFAADRSVLRERGGSDWNRRSVELKIPVLQADIWNRHGGELALILNFLTGDDWSFTFVQAEGPAEEIAMPTDNPERVVLLSGGADSLIGALSSRQELAATGKHDILVSHFTAKTLSPIQRTLVERIGEALPGRASEHIQIRLGRSSRRIDRTRYPNEISTRSRSLLFLALGLAVASVHRVALWIPENGFASINPPLGMDRLGTLSTHTTHPTFLANLRALLGRVGAHEDLTNPYADKTKGEMFMVAAEILGADSASDLLSKTYSCAHTGQRAFGVSTRDQCGVCFGCLVRRASFATSGLADGTTYIDAAADPRLQGWLDKNSAEAAMAEFLDAGISQTDLIAMDLPLDYRLADAADLCDRSMAELREVIT